MEYYRTARRLYFSEGRQTLCEFFPFAEDKIAAGLVGQGSECFGYDDRISADHDFTPGFCVWLNEEDYSRYGSVLQDVYESYIELKLQDQNTGKKSLGAGKRRGVFSIGDFYESLIGCRGVPENNLIYMAIPQYALAEATNGWVFEDKDGEFSAIRKELLKGYPEDVRKAKLASCLIQMAQSGQYNFERCINHGENAAAAMALGIFVRESIKAVFLLEHSYAPYYKWSFRKLKQIPGMNLLCSSLEFLLLGNNEEGMISRKTRAVERVSSYFISRLKDERLSSSASNYLEPHAYEVRSRIEDSELKGISIFAD